MWEKIKKFFRILNIVLCCIGLVAIIFGYGYLWWTTRRTDDSGSGGNGGKPGDISSNDYLNPFTLTFKNPKTVEMLNIIILYHYVMAFLIGIIVFTFIFIFLSFFRTYIFFYPRPFFTHYERNDERGKNFIFFSFVDQLFIDFGKILAAKKSQMIPKYKEDIKKSLTDQVTHAPVLEFLWVVIPAVILIFIAYPSVMMLYYNEAYVNPIFNISAIGNQWFWTYEYNDFNLAELFKRMVTLNKPLFVTELNQAVMNLFEFLSTYDKKFNGHRILKERDLANMTDIPLRPTVDSNLIIAKDPKFLRLLSTDQCLVIPSKTPIRILVTSNDVIHSWAVPSYGVKLDAVPGRINQQLLNIPLNGTSWGQCSELCGVNHAYMPIEIKVISFGDFLFYMELKARELLLPFMLKYYNLRLSILLNFVQLLRENVDNPSYEGIILNTNELGGLLNSRKILKFIDK